MMDRQLSGLQFTSMLGKALELLRKHGLENQRQKDFPVEVAMESLLSNSPLEVAAAPDMDLVSCIDHFHHHCAADKGLVPMGQLLRLPKLPTLPPPPPLCCRHHYRGDNCYVYISHCLYCSLIP